MAREWQTKTFKSGNSLAVRLPKAVGFADGDEVTLIAHDDGSLSVWKKSEAKTLFMSLYGSMSPGWMESGRGDIEQSDYDWVDPPAAAA